MSLAKRIIPCLDIKNGRTVKGTNFVNLRDAGDPLELAKRYELEGADELVFLDVSSTSEGSSLMLELIQELSRQLSIPFSIGGGICSVDDAYKLLQSGADKIAVNSAAVSTPSLINNLAEAFGSQCIITAIDAKYTKEEWKVYAHGGRKKTEKRLFEWIEEVTDRGAGEILFTSMDHDGTKKGFALEALANISANCPLPLIASGGAGSMEDFKDVFTIANVDAALAASIFHYNEIGIPNLKNYLNNNKVNVRLT